MAKTAAERARSYIERRRTRARDFGLCVRCCKEKPKPGVVTCAACASSALERQRRKRKRDREDVELRNALAYHERAGDEASTQHFYRDAIRHFEIALENPKVEFSDRVRLSNNLLIAAFLAGDLECANTMVKRIFEGESHVSKHEEVVMALLDTGLVRWIECQTKNTLEFLRWLTQSITIAPQSQLAKRVNVNLAMCLIHLGNYVEGGKHLEIAKEVEGRSLQQFFITKQAGYLASQGQKDEALAHFEKAISLRGYTSSGGHNYVSVLDDNGQWALALGEIELAKSCYERAWLQSEELGLSWFHSYLALRLLDVLLCAGVQNEHPLVIQNALTEDTQIPRIAVMGAIVGIPLALQTNDQELLKRSARPLAIDYAFHSGEDVLIGRTAASFARLFAAQGRLQEARNLVHRAIGTVHSLTLNWDLALEVATVGNDSDVRHARILLEQSAALPNAKVANAFLSLFNAIVARRSGKTAEEQPARGQAIERFTELGWHAYADRARERDFSLDKRSLLAKPGPIGSDLPVLTLREKQVAQLVLKGLTNREIATNLSISENTVESHMASIMNRWGIRSRHQLVDLLRAD